MLIYKLNNPSQKSLTQFYLGQKAMMMMMMMMMIEEVSAPLPTKEARLGLKEVAVL